jgi:hypothetical protein
MYCKTVTVEPLDTSEDSSDRRAPLEEESSGAYFAELENELHAPLNTRDGSRFSGLIRQFSNADWRASAWVRAPANGRVLEQRIGPKSFLTMELARQWLRQIGAAQGFKNFQIVVRLGSGDLLVQRIDENDGTDALGYAAHVSLAE